MTAIAALPPAKRRKADVNFIRGAAAALAAARRRGAGQKAIAAALRAVFVTESVAEVARVPEEEIALLFPGARR